MMKFVKYDIKKIEIFAINTARRKNAAITTNDHM